MLDENNLCSFSCPSLFLISAVCVYMYLCACVFVCVLVLPNHLQLYLCITAHCSKIFFHICEFVCGQIENYICKCSCVCLFVNAGYLFLFSIPFMVKMSELKRQMFQCADNNYLPFTLINEGIEGNIFSHASSCVFVSEFLLSPAEAD